MTMMERHVCILVENVDGRDQIIAAATSDEIAKYLARLRCGVGILWEMDLKHSTPDGYVLLRGSVNGNSQFAIWKMNVL